MFSTQSQYQTTTVFSTQGQMTRGDPFGTQYSSDPFMASSIFTSAPAETFNGGLSSSQPSTGPGIFDAPGGSFMDTGMIDPSYTQSIFAAPSGTRQFGEGYTSSKGRSVLFGQDTTREIPARTGDDKFMRWDYDRVWGPDSDSTPSFGAIRGSSSHSVSRSTSQKQSSPAPISQSRLVRRRARALGITPEALVGQMEAAHEQQVKEYT